MRWLFLLLLLTVPVGGRSPRVRLLAWNLACPGGEPWEQEDLLQRAARTLKPLKPEVAVLVDAPDPERLAAAAGFTTVLTAPRVTVLSLLPMRGYRLLPRGLEVHYDQPFAFAVVAAHADTPQESWQVATRAWELRTQYPGRGVAVLGGPCEGLRSPVEGIALDPLLLRRLQPKTVKTRTLKLSPYPLVRVDVR